MPHATSTYHEFLMGKNEGVNKHCPFVIVEKTKTLPAFQEGF